MNNPIYTPGTGLARSVLEFFVANNDEVLDTTDLVAKFGASKASVPALLKRARDCGAIVYNGGLYMLENLDIAKRCLEQAASEPTAPTAPAAAPAPAPIAAPARDPQAAAPRGIDSATPADWDAAAAATRQQQPAQPVTTKAPAARGTNATSMTIPGIGALTISYEPLASRTPVEGYKWDPVLNHLAAAKPCDEPDGLATIRLPKTMAGAAKAGIESWHKRHNNGTPFKCRFRASVSGDQVLIQRIA